MHYLLEGLMMEQFFYCLLPSRQKGWRQSFDCLRIRSENYFISAGRSYYPVGKNVTHRASNFQKVQLLSTNDPQQVQ
jgi:hypothetical protein